MQQRADARGSYQLQWGKGPNSFSISPANLPLRLSSRWTYSFPRFAFCKGGLADARLETLIV